MTIDAWITDAAARDSAKTALICEDRRYDYGAMAEAVTARAAWLRSKGIGRGDRIAWYGMNHEEVFFLLFACARIGAILVPLNWRLAEAEVAGIVADCAPKLVVHDEHFAAQAGRLVGPKIVCVTAVPDLSGDFDETGAWAKSPETAPLLIVYTSGSTGQPKGVVLSQTALVANAAMSVEAHGLTSDDTVLNVLPMFHVGGLNILPTPAFSVGATVIIHERFAPAEALAELSNVTHAIVVPTVLGAIMALAEWPTSQLTNLRALSIGSTDVPREMIDAVQARGVPVVQIYGATETSPLAIYQRVPEAMATTGSIGRAGSECEIKLALGTNEILVKGANTLTEYWNNPNETALAIKDGWFHTGDVAERDADGLYWFRDRIKHVIISGGENIYPAELERVLRPHPAIAEVAVVGRPDLKWGEIPVAVVVPKGELTEEEVFVAFDGALARYKHPREVVFTDALPRNAMGKVVAADVRAKIGA
jgi:fatty-acyl-CoA synthase